MLPTVWNEHIFYINAPSSSVQPARHSRMNPCPTDLFILAAMKKEFEW